MRGSILTSFLHEGEKLVKEILSLHVIVQLVQLKRRIKTHVRKEKRRNPEEKKRKEMNELRINRQVSKNVYINLYLSGQQNP